MKNVKQMQADIAGTTDVAALEAMKTDETRATVLKAIDERIAELQEGPDDTEDDAAPPTVKGKGTTSIEAGRAPLKLQVKNPKATGLLGFKGNLYSRAEVARNPALMQAMYEAGCKAIIKG